VVGVPEAWFLKVTARFYLVPLLAGLGGAAFGHHVSVMAGAGSVLRDLAALAGAIGAVVAALAWCRARPGEFPGVEAVHLLRLADRTFSRQME